MGALTKDKLILDTANLTESDNVGAYVRSSSGTLITHTTLLGNEALDVHPTADGDSGVFVEDSAHLSGDRGQFVLGVRNDANTSLVSADGDYAPLQVDSVGRLKVQADLDLTSSFEKAEDSVHVSGDIGSYVLAVRDDTLTADAADGDYISFKVSDRGALWTSPVGTVDDDAADTEFPVKVGSKTQFGAAIPAISTSGDRANLISDKYRRTRVNNSANVGIKRSAVTIGTTAANLAAVSIDSRILMHIQNLGSKAIFIGNHVVTTDELTTANGFRIAAGATLTIEAGPDVNIFAISSSAGQDVRVLELG